MTASAHPHPHLIPDRLDATGVGDDADGRCLPDGSPVARSHPGR
jgi:hypothetical protein